MWDTPEKASPLSPANIQYGLQRYAFISEINTFGPFKTVLYPTQFNTPILDVIIGLTLLINK